MDPEAEEEPTAEHYRKRAAKTREILRAAKHAALLTHLESVAREYDEMADRLEANEKGNP